MNHRGHVVPVGIVRPGVPRARALSCVGHRILKRQFLKGKASCCIVGGDAVFTCAPRWRARARANYAPEHSMFHERALRPRYIAFEIVCRIPRFIRVAHVHCIERGERERPPVHDFNLFIHRSFYIHPSRSAGTQEAARRRHWHERKLVNTIKSRTCIVHERQLPVRHFHSRAGSDVSSPSSHPSTSQDPRDRRIWWRWPVCS